MTDSEYGHWRPIKSVLKDEDLFAKKKFGQHFLLDLNVTRKIVRLSQADRKRPVIEVGAGPGGLTRALLIEGFEKIITIEKDPRFIPSLRELVSPPRLYVIHGDALSLEVASLLAKAGGDSASTGANKAAIIANLPYNVGTSLLISWMRQAALLQSLTLMFQKEVALRIIAQPGDKQFGRLSVICQAICHCDLVYNVSASNFTPQPKVDSAVITLLPKKIDFGSNDLRRLEILTQLLFSQRRKMVGKLLRQRFDRTLVGETLDNLGIDPTVRPEMLTVPEFITLSQTLIPEDSAA